MATPQKPEESPLNVEKTERQIANLEVAQTESLEEKSPAEEMTEKLKKPTIGASLVILLIINSIQFFVGVTTTKKCPISSIIPIYLAIAGAVGIVTKVMPIINRNKRLKIIDIILSVLVLFEFIWMILGSYWIYGIYEPNYDPFINRHEYCDKTAYLLAFWLLTIHYICLVLSILIPCCIICGFCSCAAICASSLSED